MDIPLVITVEMPKSVEAPEGQSKMESRMKGSAKDGQKQDRNVVEIPPEVGTFITVALKPQHMSARWSSVG